MASNPSESVRFPNESGRPRSLPLEPDAHGQAALMLTESLIHMLVESATLSNAEARQVIATACEVKREVAAETGESRGRMQESLDLLAHIRHSFASDAN